MGKSDHEAAAGRQRLPLDAERIAAHLPVAAELPLLGAHAETLALLPRHHNDPFDHMLVAQCIAESMNLVTGDAMLSRYTPLVIPI